MSFLRHEEIYRSDVAKRLGGNDLCGLPALIGCDEFPAGYSLAGCSPAEPASASPAANDSPQGQAPRKNFSSNGNYPLNSVSHDKGSLQVGALARLAGSLFVTATRRELHSCFGWTCVHAICSL